MLKNLLILPDGTELSSGMPGAAILSLKLTQAVNSQDALTVGSVCAAMVEATVLAPEGLPVVAGDAVMLYKLEGDNRHPVGRFYLEEPVRSSANTWLLTAYDAVSLLDTDLTQWLAGLEQWPCSLYDFVQMVCSRCGVTLSNTQLPNGSYQIQRFTAGGITGRQLIRWAAEASGRFCRARPDGTLEFAWYTPTQVRIGPEAIGPVALTAGQTDVAITGQPLPTVFDAGALTLTSGGIALWDDGAGGAVLESLGLVQLPCYQGKLQSADYETALVEKVQLRLTDEDVGVVYPDIPDTGNVYTVTGNYLLTAGSREAVLGIAQSLYEQLRQVRYTPCTAQLPANVHISPGMIVTAVDQTGRERTVYVMSRTQSGGRDTLQCTGVRRLDSPLAVNNQRFQALSGKVLELRTDVAGLRAENRDAQGKAASLELTVDGITAQVRTQQEQLSTLQQNADSVQLKLSAVAGAVSTLQTEGVSQVVTETGYTFDAQGLRISKTGQEMESQLTNTGLYVRRSGNVILQADNAGVVAVDVTAKNYLIVGEHARFEDYTDGTDAHRTACYWIS